MAAPANTSRTPTADMWPAFTPESESEPPGNGVRRPLSSLVGELPAEFDATTETVYALDGESPEMVHDPVDPFTVHEEPPGCAVAVYDVGAPPVLGGSTVTSSPPGTGVTVGSPGFPGGVVIAPTVVVVAPAAVVDVTLGSKIVTSAVSVKFEPTTRAVTVAVPSVEPALRVTE